VDPNNALLHMDNVLVSPHIRLRDGPDGARDAPAPGPRDLPPLLQGKWPRSAVNPGRPPQDLPDPLAGPIPWAAAPKPLAPGGAGGGGLPGTR